MKIEQIDFSCGCVAVPRDSSMTSWKLEHCVGHQHPPTPKYTARDVDALVELNQWAIDKCKNSEPGELCGNDFMQIANEARLIIAKLKGGA